MRRLHEQQRLQMQRERQRQLQQQQQQQKQQQQHRPSQSRSQYPERQHERSPHHRRESPEYIRRIIQHEMESMRRDMRARDQSQQEIRQSLRTMSRQMDMTTSVLTDIRRQLQSQNRHPGQMTQRRDQERLQSVLGQLEQHVRRGGNQECRSLTRDVQEIKHKVEYMTNYLLNRRGGRTYASASTPAPMAAVRTSAVRTSAVRTSDIYQDRRRTTSPERARGRQSGNKVKKPLTMLEDNDARSKRPANTQPEYAMTFTPVPWVTPRPEASEEDSLEDEESEEDTSEDSSDSDSDEEEEEEEEDSPEEEPSETFRDWRRPPTITQKLPLNPVFTARPTHPPRSYGRAEMERRTHGKRHLTVSDFQRRFGDRTFTVPKATSLGGTGRTVLHPHQQTAPEPDSPVEEEDDSEPVSHLLVRHDYNSGQQRRENDISKAKSRKRGWKDQRPDEQFGSQRSLTTTTISPHFLHTVAPQTDREVQRYIPPRGDDRTNTKIDWAGRSQGAGHQTSTTVSHKTRRS